MDKILRTWLFQQCLMLSGSIHAELLTGPPDKGPYNRAIYWPDNQHDHSLLARAAKAALNTKQAIIQTCNNAAEETGELLDALAYPLFLNGKLFGVIAIGMTSRSPAMQQAAVAQVKTGAKWLETIILLHGQAAKEQLVNLVDLVAAGLEHEQYRVAATEVANELSERFSCQRVSLGFLKSKQVRVEAISHSTKVDQNSNLVRAIRDAMSEALDQQTAVVYPTDSETSGLVTRFHAELARVGQGPAICSLPLIKNGQAIGVLMMERVADKPFTAETVEQCQQIGLLLGPVLEMRRIDEQPLIAKIVDSLRGICAKLSGPQHQPIKVGFALGAVLLVWLSLASSTFRISCDSVLEAGTCRVVVAPQQGYIAEAHARAGDLVREGDLLATLDDRELLLEQRKWTSQRAQLLKEYRKALAGLDRAEVSILNARRLQTEAQLKLVQQQLERTRLVAPLNGLIVKGDLSQSLGSPTERGEVLFEVAPIGEYRAVLKVDDRDIGTISVGQQGQIRLSGIPDQLIEIRIDRVTPVSSVENGRNYFRVEAVMASCSDLLRPGMKGIARIEVGREKLLWIWTRRLVEWLQLFVWNRFP
ncbi:MAG: HlyD family efflux transporter periplasmic adaptor subunit [Deltaproteobacteria bacterium]|nr:HlyD family efflux transporter periplasmic adaptor subunit [Deltaproteobacteria bacterium]